MKIDITGVNLIWFIKKVYDLSVPQGLGFLHFEENPLMGEEAKDILDTWKNDKKFALDMDYVKGRACKMTVFKEGEKLYINVPWYDHTDKQLKNLLESVWPDNKPFPKLSGEHGIACNCVKCQMKREEN